MKDNIPTYNALISDDNEGIFVISLVDAPATETNWMCFKEQENIKFSIVNEDEHILAGVVMVADKPIYRIAPDGSEYYIVFSKDVIKRMAEKMLDDNTFNNIDIQHDGNIIPRDKVKLVELFIADEQKGIKPNYLDVPDGSLLANYKIYDDELWNMAKSGVLNGFSLEGVFSTIRYKHNKNIKHNKMSKIKEMLKSILVQLGEVTTDKGILTYDGDLAPGVEVKNEDGSKPADGEYKLEDGKIIVVKDGFVDEVKEAEEKPKKEDKSKGKDEKPKEEKPAEMVDEKPVDEKPQEKPADEKPKDDGEAKPNDVEELKKLVDEHTALLTELSDRLKALEDLVKELNETPAVEPIEQEYSKHFKSKNRACEYANALRK